MRRVGKSETGADVMGRLPGSCLLTIQCTWRKASITIVSRQLRFRHLADPSNAWPEFSAPRGYVRCKRDRSSVATWAYVEQELYCDRYKPDC